MVAGRTAARRPLSDRDPGLFGPASITWRLDREAFLLLGAGPRALLLQVAHPAIAAGVADHSSFREDPWGRLAATLRSYLTIVYGTTEDALGEVARLERLHRRVRGEVPGDGTYDARDPELALWVHATLVDSTLATADAWLGPLSPEERARAYAESLPVGRAFGIPDELLPGDLDAFASYVAGMLGPGGPVHAGPLARELAQVILNPPPGPAIRVIVEGLARRAPAPAVVPAAANALADALDDLVAASGRIPPAAVAWLLWPAIGLLPPALCDEYELAWSPVHRAVATWLVGGWRAWAAVLPPRLRQMPQALAADRRLALGPDPR